MNPFLFILSIVLGFAVSWFLVVKTTSREVPVLVQASSAPAGPGYPDDDYDDDDAPEATPAAAHGYDDDQVDALSGEEDTVATELDDLDAAAAAAPAARHVAPWADAPADGSDPAGYTVKGDRKARLYLVAKDPDFERARPDIWFVDEQAAVDAGYTHYVRRA